MYNLRPYRAEDYAGALRLITSRLPITRPALAAIWEWQIERNPFVTDPAAHRCVVEDTDSGELAAFLATMPVRFCWHGEVRTFTCPMHAAADPRYPGPFVALVKHLFAANDFVYCNVARTDNQRQILANFLKPVYVTRARRYWLRPGACRLACARRCCAWPCAAAGRAARRRAR